jgi:hypothetical protein
MAAKMVIMAMTTNNSIKVKPKWKTGFLFRLFTVFVFTQPRTSFWNYKFADENQFFSEQNFSFESYTAFGSLFGYEQMDIITGGCLSGTGALPLAGGGF